MSDSIQLTSAENKTIRQAWEILEHLCSELVDNNGASRRIPALAKEALQAAMKTTPKAAPRLACARVDVLGSVLRGLAPDRPSLTTVATSAPWGLLGCALGAAIQAESARGDLSWEIRLFGQAVDGYRAARDRWRGAL